MDTKKLIITSVKEMISNSTSKEKINKLNKKHDQKSHFVPYKYRIFGGILQSLNIQFGNFIETLVRNIVSNDKNLVLFKETGKKNINLSINKDTDRIIDEYITKRQEETSLKNFEKEFDNLLLDIFKSEKNNSTSDNIIKHDIDLLFKKNNKIYYVEFKYTDDHDTGKFIDINRKFLKTYAGLINYLNIKNKEDLVPFIYYFNRITKKVNFFVFEDTNILRGEKFFDKFLNVKYSLVEDELKNISEDKETVKVFDELYNKIRYDK